MIKHIVMWTLTDAARTAHLREFGAMLEAMDGKVDGLLRLEVGYDIAGGETASDLVLYSEFENAEALQSYLEHPDHLEIKRRAAPWIANRSMVDYRVEEDGR